MISYTADCTRTRGAYTTITSGDLVEGNKVEHRVLAEAVPGVHRWAVRVENDVVAVQRLRRRARVDLEDRRDVHLRHR